MGKRSAFLHSGLPVCGAERPRDRIVATARELFHRHGIRGVGVETIAEAAGTNKMTLYRHFESKDQLICECLEEVAREAAAKWDALAARHPDDPRAELYSWVKLVAEKLEADYRGCSLANAAVELTEQDHPARKLIENVKAVHHERLVAVCGRAGAKEPEILADTLWLLLEGARVSRQSVGPEGPSARFVRLSEAAIAAYLGPVGFPAPG